jgi:large subunit ribosomal protein L32
MATPKKKMGKCAQAHRRAKWKATLPSLGKCNSCGEMKLTHTVCSFCGKYANDVASKKAQE